MDVVEFTNRADKLSAEKVVIFLNELFLIFDDLTEKYKLEKIKTIGDAYMVASGIPDPCSDHAERLVNMAIEINDSLKKYNSNNGENVKVRIGINSGPAVAGVIGRKKFAYDIWGDTVNTASRMESYGEPGKIQVSEATYHLLKDKYDFTYRGVINVKGKGNLHIGDLFFKLLITDRNTTYHYQNFRYQRLDIRGADPRTRRVEAGRRPDHSHRAQSGRVPCSGA